MGVPGSRRTLGLVFLGGAALAVVVLLVTVLFGDGGPVGSYVALALALAGTAVVLLASSGPGTRKG